ncbi:MAG: hypothetical protein RIS06_1041 [Actinomycetota bacterium]
MPALSTVIFKARNTIDVVAIKIGKLKSVFDDMTGFYQVKADLNSADLLKVEFFTRTRGSTKWTSNGVDTGAPYSIYLDPLDFPKKNIEIKAVATNSKGKTFVLPLTKLTFPAP